MFQLLNPRNKEALSFTFRDPKLHNLKISKSKIDSFLRPKWKVKDFMMLSLHYKYKLLTQDESVIQIINMKITK